MILWDSFHALQRCDFWLLSWWKNEVNRQTWRFSDGVDCFFHAIARVSPLAKQRSLRTASVYPRQAWLVSVRYNPSYWRVKWIWVLQTVVSKHQSRTDNRRRDDLCFPGFSYRGDSEDQFANPMKRGGCELGNDQAQIVR